MLKLFAKNSKRLYQKDGKLKKNITLKQLQKIEFSHEELNSVRYSHGGGMNGDVFSFELFRTPNGPMIVKRKSPSYEIPVRCWEYKAQESAFDQLTAYLDEYKLPVWKDLPFDDEMIALDAPSTSLFFTFGDPKKRGSDHQYCSISYDNVIPAGGFEVLNGFRDLLFKQVKNEKFVSTYLLIDHNDEKKIFTGRQISNSKEEIEALIRGYLLCSEVIWLKTDDGSVARKVALNGKATFSMYNMTSESSLELVYYEQSVGGTHYDFSIEEVINEPLEALDSSWKLKLRIKEPASENFCSHFALKPEQQYIAGNAFYLTVSDDKLYIETDDAKNSERLVLVFSAAED